MKAIEARELTNKAIKARLAEELRQAEEVRKTWDMAIEDAANKGRNFCDFARPGAVIWSNLIRLLKDEGFELDVNSETVKVKW